jgi:hypothetical protein
MKKVVPGQRFSIGANDWNQIADAVNNRSNRIGAGDRNNNSNQYILISNTTDDAIPIYGIVELDGLAVDPILRQNTYRDPVFCAVYPSDDYTDYRTYAIAQEPIAPGCVGRAMIDGTTIVFCHCQPIFAWESAYHYVAPYFGRWQGNLSYAKTQMKLLTKPENNASYALVSITPEVGDGPVPAILSDNIDGYGLYRVYLYDNGYDQPQTGNAYVYLPESAYGSTITLGKRIIVYRQSGRVITGGFVEDEGDA